MLSGVTFLPAIKWPLKYSPDFLRWLDWSVARLPSARWAPTAGSRCTTTGRTCASPSLRAAGQVSRVTRRGRSGAGRNPAWRRRVHTRPCWNTDIGVNSETVANSSRWVSSSRMKDEWNALIESPWDVKRNLIEKSANLEPHHLALKNTKEIEPLILITLYFCLPNSSA